MNGPPAADALTNGTYWRLEADRSVKWAVADAGQGDWTWSALGAKTIGTSVGTALEAYSEVANIRFSYQGWFDDVTNTPADIVITATKFPQLFSMGSGTYARAYFPNEAMSDGEISQMYGSSAVYPNASGDVVLNFANYEIAQSSFAPGSNGFFAILHELGHALGLKHPHDDGGQLGRPTFEQLGYSPADTQRLTIMSYDPATNLAEWFQAFGLPTNYGYPQTLMPLDVVAIQSIYGRNMSTGAGDTVYSLFNDDAIGTVWDASGHDVVTAAQSNYGWHIEGVVDVDDTSVVLAVPLDWTAITGKWYFNIEDFIGSNFGDSITGTAADNIIVGLAGSDSLTGGGGNDLIDGGPGVDTASYTSVRGAYDVQRHGASWSVASASTDDGFDSLSSVERLAFVDLSVALDVGVAEHAGQAAQIVRAIFGPDMLTNRSAIGVGIKLLDDGMSYVDLVALAVDALRTITGLTSNYDFVRVVYQNVVGVAAPADALGFYVSALDSGQFNQATLGTLAAQIPENSQSVELVGLLDHGIEFYPYSG